MADYTILLIDYEPRSIDQLSRPLIEAGYGVQVAKDGISGAKRFAELQPDLTLIEAMLPKKHGFDLCKELKSTEHGRTHPVLIITAVYRGNKYRSQATRHYGCDAYLEKPIEAETLVEIVRGFLEPDSATPDPVGPLAELSQDGAPDTKGPDESVTRDHDPASPEDRRSLDDPSPPRIDGRHQTAFAAAGRELHPTQGALAVAGRPEETRSENVPETSASSRAPGSRPSGRILFWLAFAALLALGGTLAVLLR